MIRKTQALGLFVLLHASFCLVHGDIIMPIELDNSKEKPSKQVIESFHVQTDIRYRFATTKMCSVVRNTAGSAHEMTFDVTLPKEAFIVSFAMTIDGKVYDGEVKEKKAAKEQYDRAVERGQSAGHIQQTPRHSNRFDVSVNVANGTAVNFTLVYQEILSRKLGVYEYEMHVKPGQAVEDFNVEVFIQENRPLLFVKTPQLRKASTVNNKIEVPNALTSVDRPTETTAHIQYKPTIEQQGKGGLAARFVVQYDVEHSDKGDVLVADGYFLHLFTPKPDSALPKDIIFVLDVSGSMSGTKIAQLKQAMLAILDDLTEDDRFNILTFSDSVNQWKRVLNRVTLDIVEEAKTFVPTMRAHGGTDINQALLKALKDLQGREVQSRAGMIFFLTDGQATSGETGSTRIARNVKSENTDQNSIYTLAFGQGASFDLLKTISTQNAGFARKIYEASDAALQVESLYEEISTVAMKNVTVKYLPSVSKTTQTAFPIVQNGTEIMIGGCIDLRRMDLSSIEPLNPSIFKAEIEGTEKEGAFDITLEFDDFDQITIDPDDSLNSFFTMPRDYSGIIEKMWAFLTIKQMLTEKQGVVEEKNKKDELDKKILEMSLTYKFVTPLTSMVVTKPDSDSPVESGLEDIDLPPLPQFVATSKSNRFPSGHHPGRRRQHSFSSGYGMHFLRKGQSFNNVAYTQRPLGRGSPPSRGILYSGGGMVPKHVVKGVVGAAADRSNKRINSIVPGKRKVSRRRKTPGKPKGGKKKGKGTVTFGILRSILFKTNRTSLCLELKKIPPGKYLLAQENSGNSSTDFKAEIVTGCLKSCRFVVPESLILTCKGKSASVNLTALGSWEYKQHSDIDVTFVKMNEMILTHDAVAISITRTQKRKKMFFSLELNLTRLSTASSAMTDIVLLRSRQARKQRRVPKACRKANADWSLFLMKKRALKYKV